MWTPPKPPPMWPPPNAKAGPLAPITAPSAAEASNTPKRFITLSPTQYCHFGPHPGANETILLPRRSWVQRQSRVKHRCGENRSINLDLRDELVRRGAVSV